MGPIRSPTTSTTATSNSTTEPTASPATVTINVTAVNDAPRPGNDSYSLDEETTLAVDATDDPAPPVGLLYNDVEPDGQSLTVVSIVTPPSHANVANGGSFSWVLDGSFSYHPDSDYYGSELIRLRGVRQPDHTALVRHRHREFDDQQCQ